MKEVCSLQGHAELPPTPDPLWFGDIKYPTI